MCSCLLKKFFLPCSTPLVKRTYNLFGSFPLGSIMAISKNLRTFLFVNDERFVTPRLDAVVNLDIPILQWRSDRFNLALDTLFDGWKSTGTVPAFFLRFSKTSAARLVDLRASSTPPPPPPGV